VEGPKRFRKTVEAQIINRDHERTGYGDWGHKRQSMIKIKADPTEHNRLKKLLPQNAKQRSVGGQPTVV